MQNIDKLKSKLNFSFDNSEVIDISKIFKLAIRNKFSILLITLISTTLSIISSTFEEPVYKGSFQIIVKDKKNSTNSSNNSLLLLATGLTSDNTKTQEYILKSPSVLKPVFNFAKKNIKKEVKKLILLVMTIG